MADGHNTLAKPEAARSSAAPRPRRTIAGAPAIRRSSAPNSISTDATYKGDQGELGGGLHTSDCRREDPCHRMVAEVKPRRAIPRAPVNNPAR